MTWKAIPRNDVVSWQAGRLNNSTTYQLQAVITIISKEKKSVGEFSKVYSQIVLKSFYLARIGRPDILCSVNKLARSITKWTMQVTNAWIDWFQTFIIHVNTNSIAMWVILQNNADWDCFKTPTLQEISRTRSLRQVEHCAFSGSHTIVPISWMCKKQTSVSNSSTESEFISLDAGFRMDGIPALDLWDLIVAVLTEIRNRVNKYGETCLHL